MDRVFLDANVLFSAAYRVDAAFLRLWEIGDVERITSAYALEEARRNLADTAQLARLDRLMEGVRVVTEASDLPLPPDIALPEKDRPILAAALLARATHLLSADKRHFGPYFGRSVAGLVIVPPGQYLRSRLER